jgi:hypothetical protein
VIVKASRELTSFLYMVLFLGMLFLLIDIYKGATTMPGLSTRSRGYQTSFIWCLRTRQVWKELGLKELIFQAVQGSVILENFICSKQKKSPIIGHVGLQEMITVGCWYIWWQHRQIVNDSSVAKPSSSAFAITSLASNFYVAKPSAKIKEVYWSTSS